MSFNFEHQIGADSPMIEFTKMCVLLSLNEYPDNYFEEAKLIKNKFEEKYRNFWTCMIHETGKGDIGTNYKDYFIRVKYGNKTFVIFQNYY